MKRKDAQQITTHSGKTLYYPNFLGEKEAGDYFLRLQHEINWEREVVKMFGKTHVLSRKTAWFADEGASYRYGGTVKKAQAWNSLMRKLKRATENFLNQAFNSCLLNYYPDGSSGMSWHSDNEPEIDPTTSIASLSFGAERKFSLKHKKIKEKQAVFLKPGSLLEMKPGTQQHWLHAMPKSKKIDSPRVNLTFRKLNNE